VFDVSYQLFEITFGILQPLLLAKHSIPELNTLDDAPQAVQIAGVHAVSSGSKQSGGASSQYPINVGYRGNAAGSLITTAFVSTDPGRLITPKSSFRARPASPLPTGHQ
jgi:hypothetical protein